MGFSYEKTHITNASLTSSNNKLIGLYKLLGTPNVRLGANDVDQSNWGGTGNAPSSPQGQPFTHTIVSGMVDQFCGFLQATGSQSIYGVNFQSGNVSQSTAEATYVMSKCASSIWGIELGNEIDKYGSWSAQKQKWETLGTSLTAIPGVSIIGAAAEWSAASSFTAPFTADEAAKFGNKLRLITNHYYNAGANTSDATASTLQNLKSIITSIADTVNTAAVKAKVPDGWRYGEANTFWGHGQMGVSDTIIAALWSLDFMYLTAQHGGNGVDWHGGEVGQDGTRPFYYAAVAESGGHGHGGSTALLRPVDVRDRGHRLRAVDHRQLVELELHRLRRQGQRIQERRPREPQRHPWASPRPSTSARRSPAPARSTCRERRPARCPRAPGR